MGSVIDSAPKGGFRLVLQNPYLCGVASVSDELAWGKGESADMHDQFSTLGGLLFGYDQGNNRLQAERGKPTDSV